jgi:phosphoribosylformylglycinamidine (FGAM) synthase PurS component
MGIDALTKGTKILTKAVNVCRNIAEKLRAITGPFAEVCLHVANNLEKVAVFLETVISQLELIKNTAVQLKNLLVELKDVSIFQEFQKFLKISEVILSHSQTFTQLATHSSFGSTRGVVISVATRKLMASSLDDMMSGIQIIIKEKVLSTVSDKIVDALGNPTFGNVSEVEISKAIKELFDSDLEEDIKKICKEIGIEILKHANDWKNQLAIPDFETMLSSLNIESCTNAICIKFIEKLPKHHVINHSDSDKSKLVQTVIIQISEIVSGIIYRRIVANTGKIVATESKTLLKGFNVKQDNGPDETAIWEEIERKWDQIETVVNT